MKCIFWELYTRYFALFCFVLFFSFLKAGKGRKKLICAGKGQRRAKVVKTQQRVLHVVSLPNKYNSMPVNAVTIKYLTAVKYNRYLSLYRKFYRARWKNNDVS